MGRPGAYGSDVFATQPTIVREHEQRATSLGSGGETVTACRRLVQQPAARPDQPPARSAARLEAVDVWSNGWAVHEPATPFGSVKDFDFDHVHGPNTPRFRSPTTSVATSLDGDRDLS